MKVFFSIVFFLISVIAAFIVIDLQKALQFQTFLPAAQSKETTNQPYEKTAKLYFLPESVALGSISAQQTQIMMNSGNNEVSKVQLELKYNPLLISSIKLTLPDQSFFGDAQNYRVLFNEIDKTQGRISLALEITHDGTPRRGIGPIAHLSFTSASSGTISFTPATLVLTNNSRQSILEESQNFTFGVKRSLASPSAVLTPQPQ